MREQFPGPMSSSLQSTRASGYGSKKDQNPKNFLVSPAFINNRICVLWVISF